MAAGQPKYYETPEAMQEAIDAYFADCAANQEPITITGLALWLGFTSRQSLLHYEGYSKEFFDTVRKAKMRVENAYEKRLIARGNSGDVFALKNFDWTDTSTVSTRFVDKNDNDLIAARQLDEKDALLLEKLNVKIEEREDD